MHTTRLEAFSDAVIAIIITIMVLELKVPHEPTLEGLTPLVPVILSYILSFVYVGIYWNNHHHLIAACASVEGAIMWANLHLLFWLSLIPFVTGWMGENHFAAVPTALYGFVLLMAAVAYWILQRTIVARADDGGRLARALGGDWKGRFSPVLYVTAMFAVLISPWISCFIYALVAVIWIVPDRRIEGLFSSSHGSEG